MTWAASERYLMSSRRKQQQEIKIAAQAARGERSEMLSHNFAHKKKKSRSLRCLPETLPPNFFGFDFVLNERKKQVIQFYAQCGQSVQSN